MRTELAINGSTDPATNFLTWTPVPSQVRLADATSATTPVLVTLRNKNAQPGGQVVFYSTLHAAAQNQIQLTLPIDGSPVQCE